MSTPRKPRVFISRTTAGLRDVANEIADILHERGADVVIQTGFLPDWRSVPQMLQDKLITCDSVIALIGPANGGGPDRELARLRDERTHGRAFSFTQWEYLVARDLHRPVFTFLVSGPGIMAPFEKEDAALVQAQQQFIAAFAKDRTALYYEFTDREKLLDHIRRMELPLNVSAGIPENLPYPTLGTLFKGRNDFLAQLRTQLARARATVIRGRQAIHGMGGVGKTRAAVEYAWAHADDYRALLFVNADSPDSLERDLAALCGPLVLNLPEQDALETNVQIAAVLRWLNQNPGWLLIIDNVDNDKAQLSVADLLGALPEGHIVITSRLADWPAGVTALNLDVLSEESSIAFLLERTDDRRSHRDGDHATGAQVARILDCLALALEQCAAYIRHRRCGLADYLADWESKRQAVLAWHEPHKSLYPRSMAITYDTSTAQLSENARELFRILSWVAPDPIPVWAVEKITSLPDPRGLLIEIADLHLARVAPDGVTFTVHRMLQEITKQQQTDTKPQSLITAVDWLNWEMPTETDDVQTWSVAIPLASHSIAAATFAADRYIPEPSARLLSCAGVLLDAQANFGPAEPLMRRALAISEASFGKDHANVAIHLSNLALLLLHTNRFAEAELMMRRALAITEASFGEDHSRVARDLSNLATLLQDTNRSGEAESLTRRALAIEESSLGKGHPRVATGLNNLAQLLKATNRLTEAEPLMLRALAIDEASFGKDHPKVAIRLSNLALLLQDTNRFAEAEPMMRRALAINEASYGKGHPCVATGLNNLALLLLDTNRSAEAEPMMRRALAITEASFGERHPKVAGELNNLGALLRASNRFAEAEPLMRRALAITEASFGGDHPKVATHLKNIGTLLEDTNRSAEAEPLVRRALAVDEASFGSDHPNVATDLNNLGALLTNTKRFAEAEPLVRRALAIDEASFGTDHPKVAGDLNNLGALLRASNRFAEAEPLMRRALAITEASFGGNHPEVARDLNNLGELLTASKHFAEAEPLVRRALAIDEASFGEDHPKVAIRLANLARLLTATNRLAEAEPLMRRHVEIFLKFTRDTGHRHRHLIKAIKTYGSLRIAMGDTQAQAVAKIRRVLARFIRSIEASELLMTECFPNEDH